MTNDTPEGVIVTKEDGRRFYRKSSEFWTPTWADIQRLEKALPVFLEKSSTAPGAGADLAKRVATYRRQYVGFFRDDHKLIWVNLFCSNQPNWKTEPIEVEGGGDCYLQLTYNVTASAFASVWINADT
jgi:hypothetical protein